MRYIKSRENKYLKQASKLKNKKHRAKEEMFIIEGPKMIEEALRHKGLLLRGFVDKEHEEEYHGLIEEMDETECFLLESKLMDSICDTRNPQGIAAIVKMPRWDLENIIGNSGFFVLLDHISDPGNMGTIIRTSWALGVDGVLLSEGCVDPFSSKVVRSTMGGIFNVPLFPDLTLDDIKSLKSDGYSLLCSSLEAKRSLFSVDFTKRKVLIIGNESQGVSNDIKELCDVIFKIPINTQVDSLNAAIACAIIVSEASKQRHGYFLS